MPELPEVETVRRGIAPHLVGRRVSAVTLRNGALRRPVTPALPALLTGRTLLAVDRRAKYLLLRFDNGTLIIHLGMSGSLRVCTPSQPAGRHDHADLDFGGLVLRYRDPRRFGLLLWHEGPTQACTLLAGLGIEPLGDELDGAWLHAATRRRTPIKPLLMDGRILVGIGNIYASESLFRARIDPRTPAERLGPARCARLATAIRQTLLEAIEAGGSTLRDFIGGDGEPGYFQHRHAVYGREGAPCPRCGKAVRRIVMAQRATYFCAGCQRR